MTEKDKELKAFNQCADALGVLDRKSVMKVFQLLGVHYDMIPQAADQQQQKHEHQDRVDTLKISPGTNSVKDNDVTNEKPKRTPKAKAGSSKEPTHLIDYDFHPPGKESLKAFFDKCKATSNLEYNLVFIYWLQNVVGESKITINHVYSCYRHLNIPIPVFPQTLLDTRKRKGWIDTSDTTNLRVVREGVNFLEHDMLKREA